MDTTMAQQQQTDAPLSLSGIWILDKTRGNWSMSQYLQVLDVNPLAIEAHEKGEKEHDTIHTITMTPSLVRIIKRSRVNNDLIVELEWGKEDIEYLAPGNRMKKSVATSDNQGHLEIKSELHTMNGKAFVTDVKRAVREEDGKCVLIQELTIVNGETGQSHTTTRYFVPHTEPMEG